MERGEVENGQEMGRSEGYAPMGPLLKINIWSHIGNILLDKGRIGGNISQQCYWAGMPCIGLVRITLNVSEGAYVLDLSNGKRSLY